MILLTIIHTKGKLELSLDFSKKKADDVFEDVDSIEWKVGSPRKRQNKPGRTDIMIWQRHRRTLKI